MLKTTKKLLSLLLTAVMFLGLLAGCGNNSDSSDSSTETTGAAVSEPIAAGMLVLSTDASVKITYDADALVLNVSSLNDNGVVLSDLYTDYLGKSVTTVVEELLRLGEKQDYLTDNVKNVIIKSAFGSSLPGTSFLDNISLTVQNTLDDLGSAAVITLIDQTGLTEDGYISLDIAKKLLANQLGVAEFDTYYGNDAISSDCYICTVEISGEQYSYTINAVTGLIADATEEELLGNPEDSLTKEEYEQVYEGEEEFFYEEEYIDEEPAAGEGESGN